MSGSDYAKLALASVASVAVVGAGTWILFTTLVEAFDFDSGGLMMEGLLSALLLLGALALAGLVVHWRICAFALKRIAPGPSRPLALAAMTLWPVVVPGLMF